MHPLLKKILDPPLIIYNEIFKLPYHALAEVTEVEDETAWPSLTVRLFFMKGAKEANIIARRVS